MSFRSLLIHEMVVDTPGRTPDGLGGFIPSRSEEEAEKHACRVSPLSRSERLQLERNDVLAQYQIYTNADVGVQRGDKITTTHPGVQRDLYVVLVDIVSNSHHKRVLAGIDKPD